MKPKNTEEYFEYISIASYIATIYCFIHLHPLLLKLISYGKSTTLYGIIFEIIYGLILSIALLYVILSVNYFLFRFICTSIKRISKILIAKFR